MSSRSGQYVLQSAGYKAFIPKPLQLKIPIKFNNELQLLLSKADRALARLDGVSYTLPNPDFFVAMYVKKEAVLSSQIEGTQASLVDVLEFEAGVKDVKKVQDVEEVINYVKAMNYGLDRLKKLPMSLRLIKEIHAVLLEGVRGSSKTPGEFRKTQNWVGPPGCLLKDATFVPPPPDEMIKAMGDLENFIHTKNPIPPLVKSALIHYQFETIHPFLDGNGRIGRLLITFHLCWEEILGRPLLYLSYYFKRSRQEYYDRLNLVREKDDFEGWIKFFLEGVLEVSEQATQTARRIMALQKSNNDRLLKAGVASPLSVALLENIFSYPIIDVTEVKKLLDTTYETANSLVKKFEKAGILKEVTGKQRGRLYAYVDFLDIIAEGTKI
ncbi:MAG: Fic family protein [Actinobacteria bacterium]|nr:Fic family protein [Actinomycetota bacterium]MCL6087828.1 Fic family protein [Actinomycetota bacterium]